MHNVIALGAKADRRFDSKDAFYVPKGWYMIAPSEHPSIRDQPEHGIHFYHFLQRRFTCGPGHGISTGTLGWDFQEAGVQNTTVKTTTFMGTQNGVRIKTWARQRGI
ncbi:polygalacturonase-like protein [Tanacetum coccineum]